MKSSLNLNINLELSSARTMAKLTVLCILPLFFLLARSDVRQISSKLLEAKRFVLSGRQTVIIYRQPKLLPSTEAVLIRYLKDSTDPVFITNRSDDYLKMFGAKKYSLLFIDRMDSDARGVLNTFNKRIIFTSKNTLQAMLNECDKFGVFVVCDAQNLTIYYYNRYTKTLSEWVDLRIDPLLAATKNIAGFTLVTEEKLPVDMNFMTLTAAQLNGTVKFGVSGDLFLMYIPVYLPLNYVEIFYLIYLHRIEKVSVLVPRLNRKIPLIFILTDPFDLPS